MTTTVAVLGLGAMGLPMSRRLAASFAVRGFDVDPSRRALAAEDGVDDSPTAADAVAGADVVVISVRDAAQLDSVLFGADGTDGAASALARAATVVVTSTVGEEAVRRTADRLAAQGARTVDAPVSGGSVRAGEGDLLIMASGTDDAIQAAQPVLDAMASRLHVVGDAVGHGQQVKTINQLLCGVHTAAAAEALALAHRVGLDLDRVIDILGEGAAASFMLADRGPRIAQQLRGQEPDLRSRLDVIGKDMKIVTDLTRQMGVATPTAGGADQLYRLGEAAGLGARDDSVIATVLAPGGQHA